MVVLGASVHASNLTPYYLVARSVFFSHVLPFQWLTHLRLSLCFPSSPILLYNATLVWLGCLTLINSSQHQEALCLWFRFSPFTEMYRLDTGDSELGGTEGRATRGHFSLEPG
jgi:hypothetical protein